MQQTDTAEAVPDDVPDDVPDIRWELPVQFHSLGVDLPEEQRAAHLAEISAEIWSGGTEFQRETVAGWYGDIAASAAEDGAIYSGLLLAGTEDDRVTVATLVIQADPADTDDAGVVADALQEMLSVDPANEVMRTEAPVGPVVVTVSGAVVEFPDGGEGATTLELAQATAYIPVPGAGTLVTMQLSTPSLRDFPEYVGILAGVVDTVVYDRPGVPAPDVPQQQTAARITEAFG